MAIFAIGDVHGHLDGLLRLLDKVRYGDSDELWFVGDLVNRGPDSAGVLRFVHGLRLKRMVLGNHDFSMLVQAQRFPGGRMQQSTLDVLRAEDGEELIDGLRQFPLLHVEPQLQVLMSHAGLFPLWSIEDGQKASDAVSAQLRGDGYREFLREIFGDKPDRWSADLQGMDYWRFTVNAFCRMRYLNADGSLNLRAKDQPKKTESLLPWFSVPQQCGWLQLFGHWASLGLRTEGRAICLDGGYAWGGQLVAYDVLRNRVAAVINAK